MTPITVTLAQGLKLGEETHHVAELRAATVDDMLSATLESERAVQTPDGEWQLLASATRVGLNLLRRQVVKIGEIPGPLALEVLRRLTISDLERLQVAAAQLDRASLGGARGGESHDSAAGSPS